MSFINAWYLVLTDYARRSSRHYDPQFIHSISKPILCTGERGFRDLQDDEVPIHPSHSIRARGFPARYLAYLHNRFAQFFSVCRYPWTYATMPTREKSSSLVASVTRETSFLNVAEKGQSTAGGCGEVR
jgi:hypothetical protein